MSIIFADESLRSIGHDLELRGIKTFRIRCERGFFAVDGGYQPPPSATPVSIYYSRKDLSELNRKTHQQHDYLSASRAFIYLPDILAAVASYVHHKRGRLSILGNTKSCDSLTVIEIEYETLLGGRAFDRLTSSTIYTLCIKQHDWRRRIEKLSPAGWRRNSPHRSL
jgi:hypothetical protein